MQRITKKTVKDGKKVRKKKRKKHEVNRKNMIKRKKNTLM